MINAIAKELILRKNEINKPIETIYFGGGTPSLLSITELKFLIETIHKNYDVVDFPEVTLEANPDDLTATLNQQKNIFKNYKTIGINRLSIGIQSFFDDDLQFMNRAHSAKEAKNCLVEALNYFDNITIDLIYGIPNLSSEKWQKNLEIAFDLGINHISSYALTVEPKTALANFIDKGKYPALDDSLALEHFNILVDTTKKQGFIHYEISNFGKKDYFSKHNMSYWKGQNYLGVGPSAHSYNGKQRSWNVKNNVQYIKAIQENKIPKETELLSKVDVFNESIMIGLRTILGISLSDIKSKFGQKVTEKLIKKAQKHIDNGTLQLLNNTLKATQKGQFLTDGIAADLFLVN
jgi:oxygen-independent coproporphyrinogen-3 oxidase